MKFFLRIIYNFFAFLPDFVIKFLSLVLSFVLMSIVRFRRKIVEYNLDIVYGQNAWDQDFLKKIYHHFAYTALELARQPAQTTSELVKGVELENEKYYQDAMKSGKGTLILSGHFANWEKCIAKIAEMGKPVHVVIKDVKGFEEGYFSKTYREPHNVNALKKDGMVLKAIFKALKRGETVLMVMDQNSKRTEGCFVDFLGHSCSTYSSPLIVAAKTGASVVPTTAFRHEDNMLNQTVVFHKPMSFERNESDMESVQRNTQKVMDVLGAALMKYPAYWIWMHKRWKTRPNSEKESGLKINYS